jgi:hypothetical protein
MLTLENAIAYVYDRFAISDPILVTNVMPGTIDHADIMHVWFTMNGREERMDVWQIEGTSQLYGEW